MNLNFHGVIQLVDNSGQISVIPKPELRGFWGSSLIKPPFRVTSADVVIICPDNFGPGCWGPHEKWPSEGSKKCLMFDSSGFKMKMTKITETKFSNSSAKSLVLGLSGSPSPWGRLFSNHQTRWGRNNPVTLLQQGSLRKAGANWALRFGPGRREIQNQSSESCIPASAWYGSRRFAGLLAWSWCPCATHLLPRLQYFGGYLLGIEFRGMAGNGTLPKHRANPNPLNSLTFPNLQLWSCEEDMYCWTKTVSLPQLPWWCWNKTASHDMPWLHSAAAGIELRLELAWPVAAQKAVVNLLLQLPVFKSSGPNLGRWLQHDHMTPFWSAVHSKRMERLASGNKFTSVRDKFCWNNILTSDSSFAFVPFSTMRSSLEIPCFDVNQRENCLKSASAADRIRQRHRWDQLRSCFYWNSLWNVSMTGPTRRRSNPVAEVRGVCKMVWNGCSFGMLGNPVVWANWEPPMIFCCGWWQGCHFQGCFLCEFLVSSSAMVVDSTVWSPKYGIAVVPCCWCTPSMLRGDCLSCSSFVRFAHRHLAVVEQGSIIGCGELHQVKGPAITGCGIVRKFLGPSVLIWFCFLTCSGS